MDRMIIGFDLDRPYTQVSFYQGRMQEPETVSLVQNQDRYLIPTPEKLFQEVEKQTESGEILLADFLNSCISEIRPGVKAEESCIMITMRVMELPWPDTIKKACARIGICAENVFLQTHQESFCSFVLNQRKDLWSHHVALFEYEDTKITSWSLSIDYRTKPAVVRVKTGKTMELGKKGSLSLEHYNEKRDRKFLELIDETFQQQTFSCVYLIGDSFDKTWAVESFRQLCRRRHVFQGRNLYTKGACYAGMERVGIGKKLDDFLFYSDDMVKKNLSIQMESRGKEYSYSLIHAGTNWFEAERTCEFILGDTKEVVLYGKSMLGGEADSYSIFLKELPERPPRTTRLQMELKFISAARCNVTIRDLGFGEFYPASGHVWETVLEV